MPSIPGAGGDDFLLTKEVAAICRVNPVTVTRWFNEGRLVGHKIGPRTIRFRRSDVEAFMHPDPEPSSAAS